MALGLPHESTIDMNRYELSFGQHPSFFLLELPQRLGLPKALLQHVCFTSTGTILLQTRDRHEAFEVLDRGTIYVFQFSFFGPGQNCHKWLIHGYI